VLIASFASATGGHMLARDMEDGYLERLFTASISRVAIVLAPMLVGAGYALAQALAVLAVAALLGAAPVTGIAGAVAMLALAAAWGMAVTGYTSASALLTGDAEITRIVDVGFFSLLFFLSPILLPSDDLEGWLKPIARLNPATYVLEGMRSLMLEGWRPARLLPALAAALAFAALALSAAAGAARRRARRV
jgi:ABC-type multidrug transport system permease subunit